MQVPLPQNLLWSQVVTSPDHYVTAVPSHRFVFQQSLPPEGLVRLPIVIKDGWIMQGVPQDPQPTYIPPMQYVTLPPRVPLDGGRLDMLEISDSLPVRPILVPGRPCIGNVSSTSERSLRGSSVATRRPSEEYNIGTPIKKPSLTSEHYNCNSFSPTEAISNKTRDSAILESIEYYFSDENLVKNAYLLKQVQQEHGYVSLKRIVALKRIKSMTRDERVVAQCICRSDKLELNESGTMVRRKDPLPANIEPPRFIRSVIAINLPMDAPTVEAVTTLFSVYGDLTQVRVLKPGRNLPAYLKEYQSWIPDLGKKYCALVEFESQDEAQRACREINMKHRSSESLRVALLKPGARLKRTLYRKYKGDQDEDHRGSDSFFNKIQCASASEQCRDYDASGSGSESDCASHKNNYDVCLRNKLAGSDSGCSLSNGDEKPRKSSSSETTLTTLSSVSLDDGQRGVREKTEKETVKRNSHLPSNILRYPSGPNIDNEKGFAVDKGKGT